MTDTIAPEPTALYRVFGDADLVLYIGISDDFGRRWKQHAKTQPWWDEKRRLTVDRWYDSREEAKAAETAAIKAENPKYNIIHSPVNKPSRPKRPGPVSPRKPARNATWIDGGDDIGWEAPLPTMPPETPEQVGALRAAWRFGCDEIGYLDPVPAADTAA